MNLALIEHGEPVLGVIYAPVLGVTYRAEKGKGAWRAAAGEEFVRIHSTDPAGDTPLRVVCSRSHGGDDVGHLLPGWRIGEEIPVGTSLKFCLVAKGRADAYPRRGSTMEWDVAAGDCIFRNSGREGLRPSPLQYNKPDMRNGSFVIGVDD